MTREEAADIINPHIQTAPKPTPDTQTDSHARKGCPECNWIDPALAWTGEDKPMYCKRCGRNLHNPQQISDKTHNAPSIPEQV